jgi:hypothetical protein
MLSPLPTSRSSPPAVTASWLSKEILDATRCHLDPPRGRAPRARRSAAARAADRAPPGRRRRRGAGRTRSSAARGPRR